jgi:hypothetical protein
MRWRTVGLVFCVALSALAAKYKAEHRTDEFTGAKRVTMTGNELYCRDWMRVLYLNPQKFTEKGSAVPRFQLLLQYEGIGGGIGYMGIGQGEASLLLTIDGASREFVNAGDVVRETSNGRSQESAVYEVDPELLTMLAHAKAVAVRVHGDQMELTCAFTVGNLERLWAFVNDQVAPQSPRVREPVKAHAPF